MPLSTGTRLGLYEIISPIGAGGMGEVYRARDTKLDRDVAVKVLPESFATDTDRLMRFEREAKTLAALNHPNIAAIYGIEGHALVMELVEGEDLSAIIARGPVFLSDALPIAKQVADALEAAHEQGIIHRDLKPANIKVRADGAVKVLDFGLAKAMDPAGASGADVMNSPTLTARATQMGMIIGTAAYMAPEQARGRAVDRRADIWAFGVVLYEMLTGQRAFEGEDISITLASVLKENVRWDALPGDLPASFNRLLRRCLEKDPKRRLSWIGEARLTLEDPAALEPAVASSSAAATATVPTTPLWRRALPWAVAGILGGALVAALVLWAPWRTAPVPAPRKLLASIGADAALLTGLGASAILSPDGTTLAFVARQDGQTRLFVRKLDQLQAAALAGTEDAASPFFSPDGQWIAFFANAQLKKVSVTGGSAIKLCDASGGRGGTWTDDDMIIFTPSSGNNATLMRVPAAGGPPAAFGTLSNGATTQRWPQALPGARGVIYTEHSSTTNYDGANLVVAPLSGGPPKIVVHGGYYGRYVPGGLGSPKRDQREGGGHLIYMNQGTLFAVSFDLDRLETVGQPVPATDGVSANVIGGVQLALSSDGTLIYVPGGAGGATSPIEWLTRDGRTSVLRATKADWANLRFSPDGQRLAMDISDGKQRDIWVYEWARNNLTQLTFDAGEDRNPVWTPDGRRIVFQSDRAKPGIANLYWVNADGTGEVTRLSDSPDFQRPHSWHPSGKFLGFTAVRGATGVDAMVLPMEGDAAHGWTPGTPTVFLSTPANEGVPMFSPDGRWIAYASTEAGGSNYDVYVRPFPGPGGKWRISTTGGTYPQWSASTHELLFLNYLDPTPSKIMAAPYTVVGESFHAETPKVWSPTSVQGLTTTNDPYDLHPDGKRIAAAAVLDQAGQVQDHVVFVFNFAEYLAKIAPGKK